MNPPQKRNHAAAFTQQNKPRPRPTAPPAVPSFNASIAHLLPVKPLASTTPTTNPSPTQATRPSKPQDQPKKNLLGLTPSHPDDSSSEDDADEEARLVGTLDASSTNTATPGLSFSYKGQLSSLKTAEEIKAWIAERRQRFPTIAKADAAKKEREEKKRKWEQEKAERKKKMEEQRAEKKLKYEEEKKARELARQMSAVEKELRSQNDVKETEDNVTPTSKAEALAEKLRKRALKAEKALKKAEEALRIAREKELDSASGDRTVDAASNDIVDPDETSSSGSSDSDSDDSASTSSSDDDGSESDASSAAPETISTKDPSLANLPPITAARPQTPKKLRLCGNFVRYKRCRYGSGCRYSHDLTGQDPDGTQGFKGQKGKKPAAPDAKSAPTRRKGLYQVMVQKEEEEARRKVAMAILRLGEKGLLDDPSPSTGT